MEATATPTRIDPAGKYTAEEYAAYLRITPRQLRTRVKLRKAPRPFYEGRFPMFLGSAILAWEQRQQAKAQEVARV